MPRPDSSILCTCGPRSGVIPPPPCPIHRSPEWHDKVRKWATTPTPVFTEEMIRRAMGQEPCDVQDIPFCGWDDALPPSLLDVLWWPLTAEQVGAMDFDGIDESASITTFYGVSGARASDRTLLGRLAAAVTAWREARTKEDDGGDL